MMPFPLRRFAGAVDERQGRDEIGKGVALEEMVAGNGCSTPAT